MITSSLKKMVFGYSTMNVFMIVFKKKQTLDRIFNSFSLGRLLVIQLLLPNGGSFGKKMCH
jgi:hypothetical protein